MEEQPLEMWAEALAEKMRNLDDVETATEAAREFTLGFIQRFENFFRGRGLPDDAAAALSLDCAGKIVKEVAAGKYEFRRMGGFIAWAFTFAEWEAKGWYRMNKPTFHYEEIGEYSTNNSNFALKTAIQPESFEALLEFNESTQLVQVAIGKLSPDDERILRMRHFGLRLDYDEIASKLGINNGAARTRYSRALDRLKKIIEDDPKMRPILQKYQPKAAHTAIKG